VIHETLNPKKSELVVNDGRAYHLGLAPYELARNVFLVGDPARATRVASYFDNILHEASNREYVTYTGSYKDVPVSVIGTGIGADNVEIAFVESYVLNEFDLNSKIKRLGAPMMTFIRLGTSGGVQPDLAAGTLVISDYALGLDSTGPYYDVPVPDDTAEKIEKQAGLLLNDAMKPASRFRGFIKPYVSKASSEVAEALRSAAASLDYSYESGITATSPGFYGPSSRYIDGFENSVPDIKNQLARVEVGGNRVLNMEMESSLLFHMATAVGYRAGTVCPIISSPSESDALIDYEKVIGETIAVGLKAMLALN